MRGPFVDQGRWIFGKDAEGRASGIMLKAKVKKADAASSKVCDTADHVTNLHAMNATPNVKQNGSTTLTGKRHQSPSAAAPRGRSAHGMSQSCRTMTDANAQQKDRYALFSRFNRR